MSTALYHQRIVELASRAGGAVRLADPHGSARVDNPLCGDEVEFDVRVAGPHIDALGFRVRGCLLCEASAQWITEHLRGGDAARVELASKAARALLRDGGAPAPGDWPDLDVFAPVHAARSRHRCVMLPFEAVAQALGEARREISG